MFATESIKNKLKIGAITFWVSLLLHLLLVIAFSIRLLWSMPSQQDSPSMYVPPAFVPSYMYRDPSQPQPAMQPVADKTPIQPKKADIALTKPTQPKAVPKREEIAEYPPKTASKPIAQQQPMALNDKNAEAINLVGDKKVVKPLLAILGRALAQHLFYPRIAIDFNLHGISYVGFTLHPNGLVSNVRIVKSSGEEILDKAAVTGVSAISPVRNVDTYVKKPEFIIAGIIFK